MTLLEIGLLGLLLRFCHRLLFGATHLGLLVTWWSVSSSEVTKCDTNTSPRRLATHLLQQVVQSLTSRRHSGHGSATATRNNTKGRDHTTIAKASKASSKYHAMEDLWGDHESTGTVGCRAATTRRLLELSLDPPLKNNSLSKGEYIRTQQVQPHPRRGLWTDHAQDIYIKDQVKVYLQTHLLMQGFIFEKVFANHFYNPSNSVVLRKPIH
jgi:hypothetical protein